MLYSTPNFSDVLTSGQLDRSQVLLDGKTIHRAFLREMLHTGTQRTLKAAVQDVQQLRMTKALVLTDYSPAKT